MKDLLMYAVDASEYINISEVFSLPFKYRQLFVECINKHVEKVNKAVNSSV